MSDWTIKLPHRHRDEPLSVTAGHCRRLPAEDRETARAIVIDAATGGLRTAGQLIDRLQGMDAHERRALLDRARAEVGLEPTADVDARLQFEAANRLRAPRPVLATCAAPDCPNAPTNGFGALVEPDWSAPASTDTGG